MTAQPATWSALQRGALQGQDRLELLLALRQNRLVQLVKDPASNEPIAVIKPPPCGPPAQAVRPKPECCIEAAKAAAASPRVYRQPDTKTPFVVTDRTGRPFDPDPYNARIKAAQIRPLRSRSTPGLGNVGTVALAQRVKELEAENAQLKAEQMSWRSRSDVSSVRSGWSSRSGRSGRSGGSLRAPSALVPRLDLRCQGEGNMTARSR